MDALARKFVGDKNFVEKYIVNPIRDQVLEITWLPERYTCAGEASHHLNYHEFPEVLTMVLHDVVYGISVGFSEISINPMHMKNFHYKLGNSRITWVQSEKNEWEGEHDSPNLVAQLKKEISMYCEPEYSTSFVLEFPNSQSRVYKVHQQVPDSPYKIKKISEFKGTTKITEIEVKSNTNGILTVEYFSGKIVGCRHFSLSKM